MGRQFKSYTPPDSSNLRIEIPRAGVHNHSYGGFSPYFRALVDKKLVGTHCTSCELTFLPPRPDCPDCWGKTEWVSVHKKGTVATFSTVQYPGEGFIEDLATVGAELPCVIVYVKIAGVDTNIMSRLEDCEPKDVYDDMPVKAKFVDDPNLNCLDLYWVPDLSHKK